MKKKFLIRSKKDSASLYILDSGEVVFCQSVATCFSSLKEANEIIDCLGLCECYVVSTIISED